MTPIDVKSSTCIYFGLENNYKDHKFKVHDHVRISKYKNIYTKRYASNWKQRSFCNKKC